MLKLVLASLLVIVPVWAANEYPYSLVKLYPGSREQVIFLKQLVFQQEYQQKPAVYLTPLGIGKTAYLLIPVHANVNYTELFRREHIPMRKVDAASIKSAQVNNEMHRPSETPSSSRSGKQGYIISSPRVTNWGVWGDFGECSAGQYVVGMRLKTETKLGNGDDSALNAIELLCAAPGSREYTTIKSLEGQWGDWGRTLYCPPDLLVRGFQLRSEAPQGSGDDTAANNLRLYCSSGSNIRMLEGDGQDWGSWTESQYCLDGQAVTGFRTQVEPPQGSGDDTALNNVEMVCNDQASSTKVCKAPGEGCGGDKECCSESCYMGTCQR